MAKISTYNVCHPLSPSLNVVIGLVAEKSTRFNTNTNTTLRSVGGEGYYFWPKFCQDINSTILVDKTPKYVISTLWWQLTKHFGLQGRKEHHSMKDENFSFRKDGTGAYYMAYIKKVDYS